MLSIDLIDEKCRRKLVYWAVIEHYRSWLIDDGVLLKRLSQSGGKLDAVGVRRIAKIYKVNRGIPKGDSGSDRVAAWIADRLNNEAAAWPGNLNDRARRCAEISAEAKNGGHVEKEIVSLVTKLMWFLRPKGWTVFDRLASQGIGIKETRAPDRMEAFYRKLSESGFDKQADLINNMLKYTPFQHLFGERVIDKFLVLCGSEDDRRREAIETCQAFLTLLPVPLYRELDAISMQISNKVRLAF